MSSRDLTANIQAELQKDVVTPVLFFESEFNTSTVRLWTGANNIDWNGQSWLGNGWLLGFSPLIETGSLKANGMSVRLTGVPISLLAEVIGGHRKSLYGRLWWGFLDENEQVIADPYLLFEGKTDTVSISQKESNTIITLGYESELILLERRDDYTWNKESQKIFDTADTGFNFVTRLAEQEFIWGA